MGSNGKVTPELLEKKLLEIEPDLMAQVPDDHAKACLGGACKAINDPAQGRGR